jgi:PmbA protein
VSGPSLDEVAAALLAQARQEGASAADVVVAEGDALMVGVRLGAVEKVKRSRARHLGLRVFVGARSAVTSTADFSAPSLAQLVADSVAMARVTADDPYAGLPGADELAVTQRDLDLYDAAVAEVAPEQAVEWCQHAEDAARAADARITNSEGAEFHGSTNLVVYAASNGFHGSYRTSHASLTVVPVAIDDGAMERDYWYSAARHLARLDPPEQIGRTAAVRTVRRLGARQVPTGEVPVVFDPETAASLLGHLAAAASGGAIYRQTSFLIGKLGQPLAPPFVHVIDDGTLVGQLGSKPFDAEGLATRCTTVIDAGVLRSYLLDCYSARKLDARSTGNAARSVADAPYVSPTNLFLVPGDTAPEAIIGSVRSGLYVTELMGFGVNPVTGDYSRGATGLWIENGALTHPVAEVTIAGNLLQMFRDLEAIGSDLVLRHGISAPTVKIARLTVAGQ